MPVSPYTGNSKRRRTSASTRSTARSNRVCLSFSTLRCCHQTPTPVSARPTSCAAAVAMTAVRIDVCLDTGRALLVRALSAAILVIAMPRQYTKGALSSKSKVMFRPPCARTPRFDAVEGNTSITTNSHSATIARISASRRIGLLGCFMQLVSGCLKLHSTQQVARISEAPAASKTYIYP